MALSDAERAARYRERRKAIEKPVVVRYRRPADRRSKAKHWDDAVDALLGHPRRVSGVAGQHAWRSIGQRHSAASR
jgi:hypothetical protein